MRRAPRQPFGWAAYDWKYGRRIYRFRAGAGKFVKRVLTRWRRHHGQLDTNRQRIDMSSH